VLSRTTQSIDNLICQRRLTLVVYNIQHDAHHADTVTQYTERKLEQKLNSRTLTIFVVIS